MPGPPRPSPRPNAWSAERQPDVAVVDVNLKGEMAYGLIDLLHDRGVRVIVVSGYAVLPKSARTLRMKSTMPSRH